MTLLKYMTALEASYAFSVSQNEFFKVKNSSYRYKFQKVMPKTLKSCTKYLTKVEKSSNTTQEKKSLISTSACFLTTIPKV